MKKVLLTTTALVMTAGVAAADVSLSGSAKLTYGDWDGGTTTSWGSTTDLSVAMSGEASGIAYSAGLSIDETDSGDAAHIGGSISISSNGLSLAYGPGMDADAGEASDETGDLKIAYAGSGVTISYVENANASEAGSSKGASKVDLGYTINDITIGLSSNSTDKSSSGAQINTLSVGFNAGDMKISLSGNDAALASATDGKADWDASLAYTLGASTVTLAVDEDSKTAISVATSLNDLTLSAKAKDTDNELSISYKMGDISMSYAYDEGAGVAAAADGDDAQTIMSISYDLGGIVLKGQSNNKNEVQVSAAFTF